MPFSATKKLFLTLTACLFLLACGQKHEYKPVPFRAPEAYSNHIDTGEATYAAEYFPDEKALTDRFGYNLYKAGVLPINLVLQNHGEDNLVILPGPTVTDSKGQIWELLPQDVVLQRINDYTSGVTPGEGVARTAKGAVVGAILGAAVGIATGTNVGSAAGKGAAIGGAIGVSSAILGQGKDQSGDIAKDYTNLSLQQSSLGPDEIAHGLLFFPAEVERPVRLTLRVKIGEEKPKTVALPL
ncbi:MAG: hypothetical protein LBS60_06605 [Deltaproteobacteria bacterium]|jgi:hypothetical protein|nr:hypothetical protein [Deltaproteobacteria bacterium]